jgi:hypothetical protein
VGSNAPADYETLRHVPHAIAEAAHTKKKSPHAAARATDASNDPARVGRVAKNPGTASKGGAKNQPVVQNAPGPQLSLAWANEYARAASNSQPPTGNTISAFLTPRASAARRHFRRTDEPISAPPPFRKPSGSLLGASAERVLEEPATVFEDAGAVFKHLRAFRMHFENDPGFESHHRRLVGRNSASGAAPESPSSARTAVMAGAEAWKEVCGNPVPTPAPSDGITPPRSVWVKPRFASC